MLRMYTSAALVLLCAVLPIVGEHGATRRTEAAAAPHIDQAVVATLVAGDIALTGSSLGAPTAARSLRIDYDGKSTTIASGSPLVHAWTGVSVNVTLPPEVHSGQLTLTVDGVASAPSQLLVYMYTATSLVTATNGSAAPLALDLDAQGNVWINEEFHTELKSLSTSDPPAMTETAIPQGEGAGIFAQDMFGDSSTRTSVAGEDIHVAQDGSVWFTEGGASLYGGSFPNASRIVRYEPASRSFSCYIVPTDNAEIFGVLLDAGRGKVWYAESALDDGNAIGGFDLRDAASDCAWTPDSGPAPPVCAIPRVPGCHQRFALPHPSSSPAHLAMDAAGNIWFSEYWGTRIGRLNPDTGELVELPLPAPIVRQGPGIYAGSGPWSTEFDANGDLWVSEFFDATIMRIRPSLMSSADCTRLDANGKNPCATEIFAGSNGLDGNVLHTLSVGSEGRVWFGLSETAGPGRLGFVDTAHNNAVVLLPGLAGTSVLAGIVEDSTSRDVWIAQFTDRRIGRLQLAAGDADGIPDATDNCPAAYNPGQENHDGNFVDLSGYGKPFNDLTWPKSDLMGDACDVDADNDGLTNIDETTLPNSRCPSATRATDPLQRDSDGDMVLDGAECALHTDPANRASVPARLPPGDSDRDGLPDAFETTLGTNPLKADSDGDGLPDGLEYKYYGSDPLRADSDGDNCGDAREAGSVNSDRAVNAIDFLIISSASGPSTGPRYVPDFDINKDRYINSIDIAIAASLYGYCPYP